MRLIVDTFAYCAANLPSWNTISISGYHIREAGSTAVQEIAFTLANGIAYVEAAIAAGMDVDAFAPGCRSSGTRTTTSSKRWPSTGRRGDVGAHHDRALRRKDERSKMLRFHTQTGGSTLTAQQPENNIVRVTVQSLAAALGGTQSLHTNGFDEALGLPTTRAAKIALRTQQIVGFESGVADTVDPLAGSYFVEALTDEVEAAANDYLERIEQLGGAVAAIEARFMQEEIEAAAYSFAKAVDDGEKVVVGVNRFIDAEDEQTDVFPIDVKLQQLQIDRTRSVRAERDQAAVDRALADVAETAKGDGNLLVPMKAALKQMATSARCPTSCGPSSASTSPGADAMTGEEGRGSFWPLFGLIVRTPRLELRLPREEEFADIVALVDGGVHDPGIMPFFVPWTDQAPVQRARATAQWLWGHRANWNPDKWTLTARVRRRAAGGHAGRGGGAFRGRALGRDGLWLGGPDQGQGLGREMRGRSCTWPLPAWRQEASAAPSRTTWPPWPVARRRLQRKRGGAGPRRGVRAARSGSAWVATPGSGVVGATSRLSGSTFASTCSSAHHRRRESMSAADHGSMPCCRRASRPSPRPRPRRALNRPGRPGAGRRSAPLSRWFSWPGVGPRVRDALARLLPWSSRSGVTRRSSGSWPERSTGGTSRRSTGGTLRRPRV